MRANPDLPLDVVGVGNAIVDVIANVSEEFLTEQGVVKGAMTLIDTERASSLYAAMPPGIETSGGSAANTMAGIASLGGHASYIGKGPQTISSAMYSATTPSLAVSRSMPQLRPPVSPLLGHSSR